MAVHLPALLSRKRNVVKAPEYLVALFHGPAERISTTQLSKRIWHYMGSLPHYRGSSLRCSLGRISISYHQASCLSPMFSFSDSSSLDWCWSLRTRELGWIVPARNSLLAAFLVRAIEKAVKSAGHQHFPATMARLNAGCSTSAPLIHRHHFRSVSQTLRAACWTVLLDAFLPGQLRSCLDNFTS